MDVTYPTLNSVGGVYVNSANVFFGGGAFPYSNGLAASHQTNSITLRANGSDKFEIGAAGNLVVKTAGAGIDFTQDPNPAGMTSELLNWYEEGAWTPTDASGAALTFTSAAGSYTRVGRLVNWQAVIAYPSTANASDSLIGGLPFTVAGGSASQGRAGAFVSLTDVATLVHIMQVDSSTTLRPYKAGFVRATNADLSSSNIYIGGFFVV
jgi:hypothetical protein